MPTYIYAPKGEPRNCEVCSEGFELVQKMSEDALSACPKCGGAIERVITAPNLNGVGFMSRKPNDKKLAAAGFTQYKRQGKGYYEKSFGQGPSTLHDN